MPPLLRLLRPHQWAKNALAFVGLLAAHRWGDVAAWLAAVQMFLALSLVASAVYVLNDALDVDSDRQDPDKRERPLASGSVSIRAGLALIPLLLGLAIGVSWQLPQPAQWALATYASGALIYNLGIKRALWLDVVLLAVLYAMRVIAGALAAAIEPSPWLVGFSLFVFVSLASLKRYAELVRSAHDQLPGRAYRRGDGGIVAAFGIAAGVSATVVLALYVNGSDVTGMYQQPQVLWALAPIVLTWLARMWTLAHRGEMPGDPVLYALRDRGSWLAALALLGCVGLAT
ncbi:MAG: UbiA family prenyltransferase [Rhodanobacteraceae bacterium]|nr:UbiA family prenyltransferase [Rhodanobacteraceae bacterium]